MTGYCDSTGTMGTLSCSSIVNYDDDEEMIYSDECKPLYSRIEIIGEGTYGTVYLARNVSTSKLCVIKQMKHSQDDEGGIQPTQLREASLLKKLKHKYIIEIQDIFLTYNQDFCLVFECCKMDLAQFMLHNKINLELIQKWSYQMIEALSYIHSKSILHRDLKPQNIFITHDMNTKIGDFGLAKEFILPLKAPMTTNVVTLWYRPLELLLGAKCYSTKLDIWSLGCIIAEMGRNGRVLFGGFCEWEVIIAIFQFLGNPSCDNSWCKSLPHFSGALPQFKGKKFDKSMGCLKNDELAIDLLKQMLNADPAKRVNAIKLTHHRWFDAFSNGLYNKHGQETQNKSDKTRIQNNKKWEQYFDEIKEIQSPSTPNSEYLSVIEPKTIQFLSRSNSCNVEHDDNHNKKRSFGKFNENTIVNNGSINRDNKEMDMKMSYDDGMKVDQHNLNEIGSKNRNAPSRHPNFNFMDVSPVY